MIYVIRFTLISSNSVISKELLFLRAMKQLKNRQGDLTKGRPVVRMSWTDDITIKNFDQISKQLTGSDMKAIMIITVRAFISKHFA